MIRPHPRVRHQMRLELIRPTKLARTMLHGTLKLLYGIMHQLMPLELITSIESSRTDDTNKGLEATVNDRVNFKVSGRLEGLLAVGALEGRTVTDGKVTLHVRVRGKGLLTDGTRVVVAVSLHVLLKVRGHFKALVASLATVFPGNKLKLVFFKNIKNRNVLVFVKDLRGPSHTLSSSSRLLR